MKVLVDHTEADWSHLLVGDIEERAEFVKRMAGKIGKQRVAWASRTARDLVSGRYVGYLLDWNVPFVAHGFTSVSEAREWLRQPPDEPNQPTPHVQPRR